MIRFNQHVILFVALAAMLQISCATLNNKNITDPFVKLTAADCINHILSQDSQLGAIRNHACETIPLTEAIQEYINAVNALSFGNCPLDFTHAFESHLNAWNHMQTVTDKYPDLRGELHDLFDKIKLGEHKDAFEVSLKNIWDTWAEVEKAQNRTIKN